MGDGTTFVYKNVVNQETGKDEYKSVKVPVKYFDVTDRARAMIVRHAYEIDSPDDFLGMVQEFDMNTLCPAVDDYPWDDDEVNDFVPRLSLGLFITYDIFIGELSKQL